MDFIIGLAFRSQSGVLSSIRTFYLITEYLSSPEYSDINTDQAVLDPD